jgi:tRNA(Ile)-lysidine synthase
VAVGHTLNDQVETILLHIIRGAGMRGLRGLQPTQSLQFSEAPLTVIRPLLKIARQETEDYCSQLHLTPCSDTSNFALSRLRNRVRHELLPLLQSYNPGIFESLLRTGSLAEEDLAFLESERDKAWQKIVRKVENTLILDKKEFQRLAPALQRLLLRKAMAELLGTLKDIETRHIEEIMGSLDKPAGRQITLPEGLIFSLEYERYLLGYNPQELCPFPSLTGDSEIKIPGETRLPGWKIEATVTSPAKMRESLEMGKADNFCGCFDQDRVGRMLKVRTRLRGDRFQPLGMSQSKKVGEFMQDARIPQTWRQKIPIVYSPQQIIWVAGWRIDERVKVTQSTREVLCLKMVKGLGA